MSDTPHDNTPTRTHSKITFWRHKKTGRIFWENNDWPATWDFCEPATEEDMEKQRQSDFKKSQSRNPPNRDLLNRPSQNNVKWIFIGFDDRYLHEYAAFVHYKIWFLDTWVGMDNIIPLELEDIGSIAIRLIEEYHFALTISYSDDNTQAILEFRTVSDD